MLERLNSWGSGAVPRLSHEVKCYAIFYFPNYPTIQASALFYNSIPEFHFWSQQVLVVHQQFRASSFRDSLTIRSLVSPELLRDR